MSTNDRLLFTSESVSEGHPDKLADQVSDAVLDAYLAQDPDAKVACECLVTTGQLILAGEITSSAHVDGVAVARGVVRDIGYDDASIGFDHANAHYLNLLHEQSREINHSVSDGGAGDQGLMFGFACRESPTLMPLPIHISHRLMEAQSRLRKEGAIDWLLPDAKSQVTVLYVDGQPKEVTKVVLSTQHRPGVGNGEIRRRVVAEVIEPVLEECLPGSRPDYLINPSGSFTIGGPHGDTGLTGRKIIVDTYGGSCPHGGGAFSGKDPSKVDRSAAYMARYVARHLVEAGLAERATVQLSYAIGVAEPTSVYVNTDGTGRLSDEALVERVVALFDLTPSGIIRTLGLKRPIYRRTAAYGHFGRPGFPWEQTDQALLESLRRS
jgi:S-adenosylmethionine synthetase